jgi:hypothetical protein
MGPVSLATMAAQPRISAASSSRSVGGARIAPPSSTTRAARASSPGPHSTTGTAPRARARAASATKARTSTRCCGLRPPGTRPTKRATSGVAAAVTVAAPAHHAAIRGTSRPSSVTMGTPRTSIPSGLKSESLPSTSGDSGGSGGTTSVATTAACPRSWAIRRGAAVHPRSSAEVTENWCAWEASITTSQRARRSDHSSRRNDHGRR